MKKFSKIKKVLAGAILTATLTTGIGLEAQAANYSISNEGLSANLVNNCRNLAIDTTEKLAVKNDNSYPMTITIQPRQFYYELYDGVKHYSYRDYNSPMTITLAPEEKRYIEYDIRNWELGRYDFDITFMSKTGYAYPIGVITADFKYQNYKCW